MILDLKELGRNAKEASYDLGIASTTEKNNFNKKLHDK